MVRYFERPAALYITRVLLHTPVTANQVTLAGVLIALLGGALLAIPGGGFFFAGMCLYQLWYLADHVDGQIARYRKTEGLEGLYLDFMAHHVVTFVIPLGAAFSIYLRTGRASGILAGCLMGISLTLIQLLSDSRTKAMVTVWAKGRKLASLEAARSDKSAKLPDDKSTQGKPQLLKKVFSLMHKLCEGHVVMNLWTLFGLLYWWRKTVVVSGFDSMEILVWFYGILATLVWTTKLFYTVQGKKVTEEYLSLFDSRSSA